MSKAYEVLIIGGGPAGLSAAMTLGRMSRRALLCDDDQPRNAPSSHINNFPSRDGIHPAEWRQETRRNLEKYRTIESIKATVTSVQKGDVEFVAQLSTGEVVNAKKIILAEGVKDTLPAIEGVKELWGKSIFHCPFCHGFEHRGSSMGFVGNGDLIFHALPMIFDLASDLMIFTQGKAKFSDENLRLLEKNKVTVIEEPIRNLEYQGDILKGLWLNDGTFIQRRYLFLSPNLPFKLKSDIGEKLGCEKNEFGFYKVNERNQTSVRGVYACGDNMTMGHSVLLAAAAGVLAGSSLSAELLHEKMSQNSPSFFNKEHAAQYDEKNSRLKPISECLHFLTGTVLRGLPESARVLSVGAGTGAEILTLARLFPKWSFVAVDPAGSMLDVCKEKLEKAGVAERCRFIEGYVHDVSESDFDVTISLLAGHFVQKQNRLDFYQGMTTRLKPGGYFVNAEISYDLESPEFSSMLKNWEEVQKLLGATPESLAMLPKVLKEALTVLAPQETESFIRQSGIQMPIRFFQAFMICAWYGIKS